MTPLKNSQERWLETALEEYKALREEVLAQFLNRNQILTFGSAILGGLIVSLKDDNNVLLYVSGALLIPALCTFIILLWGLHSAKIARIGIYLKSKERHINHFLEQTGQSEHNALNWEHSLRNSKKFTLLGNDEIVLTLLITVIFTLISLTYAVYIFHLPEPSGVTAILFKSIFSTIIVAGFAFGIWCVHKINHFPNLLEPTGNSVKRGNRKMPVGR